MNALCGKNVQLLQFNLVHEVIKRLGRICLRPVGISRTKSLPACGKLATHFQIAPRWRLSGDVIQLFHTPSSFALEQLYNFVKL